MLRWPPWPETARGTQRPAAFDSAAARRENRDHGLTEAAGHPRRRRAGPGHQCRHLGRDHRGAQPRASRSSASAMGSSTSSAAIRPALRPLAIDDVSRVHLLGGSMLGTSRENPTTSPEATRAVIETLQQAGITHLVTIGGDDTALSSRYVSEHSTGAIRSVHVPKTIDNDLPLPPHVPTFGFQTARHVGVELVRNLMEDARSTRRWYIVVAMGRKAGHLALGIGKAAGATLTIVAEECRLPLRAVCHDLRHRRRRDHQAAGDGAPFRRRGAGRGPHRQARSGRARRSWRTSSATSTDTCGSPKSISRERSRPRCRGGSASAVSASRSPTRTSATSCDARTRFPSMPSTAATSATAPCGSCSAAAAGPWSASRAGVSCRFPSTTSGSQRPARRRYASWTPTARGSESPAPT